MAEPPARGPSRLLAGVVAFVVAAGAFAFLVSAFGDEPGDRAASDLDPAVICDVPAYDPDVALLVGQPTREVALADLEAAGRSVSELQGPAADQVRAYVASSAGRNAPLEGWREVDVPGDEVVFVAPHEPDGWWVLGFTPQPDGDWRQTEEEIVEQAQTPTQRGHDLRLDWNGPIVVDAGSWNDPLRLVNDRSESWTDAGEHWGIPYAFDQRTGAEVVTPMPSAGWSGEPYSLEPGGSIPIPVALAGALPSLAPGRYEIVACVPALGLASGVGEIQVRDTGVVPEVHVLTYPFEGVSMAALDSGTLTIESGCLAMTQPPSSPVYLLWPHGHVLVTRDDRQVLIDPIGRDVAAVGDDVTVGGGFAEHRWIDDLTAGDVPEACRAPGEGYFITSGLAEGVG